MPVYGGKPFGTQSYGDTPDIAIPELTPIANSFGDIAYGSDSFGGSALDVSAPSGIGQVTELPPVVSASAISGHSLSAQVYAENAVVSGSMDSVVIETVALSFGDAVYGGVTSYGGLSVNSTKFTVAINEPLPVVNSDIGKVSFSVAVEEPNAIVSATNLQSHDLVGAVSELLPNAAGAIVQSIGLAGNTQEPLPVISASIDSYYFSSSSVEPLPLTAANVIKGVLISPAITELLPVVSAGITRLSKLPVAVTEPNAVINAEIAAALVMVGQASEPLAIVEGVLNDNAGHVTEPKPTVSGSANTGRALSAIVREKAPIVSSDAFGERLIKAYLKEAKPNVSAKIANGAEATGGISESAPIIEAKLVSGALITGNVIDIKPVIAGKFLFEGLLVGDITEPLPLVVSKITNIHVLVINEGDITAYALNTENMAITEYTNYQFTALSEINGKLYGIKSDGVYLLEGSDDNGIPIASSFLTGSTDMDSDRLKRTPLIHADAKGDIDILMKTDDTTHVIPFAGRAKIGRGIRANHLSFGAKSSTSMSVQSIEPTIEILKKRAL